MKSVGMLVAHKHKHSHLSILVCDLHRCSTIYYCFIILLFSCYCIVTDLCYLLCIPYFPITETLDECDEDTFQCDNGQCISLNLRCDFFSHCTDKSDEQECGKMENHTINRLT